MMSEPGVESRFAGHEPFACTGRCRATVDSSDGPPADSPFQEPRSITRLAVLGQGRAARAELVDVEFSDGQIVRCVEKIFRPRLLTRWIYRAAFQAPFAYEASRDAILACYDRRRVAAAVVEAFVPGVRVSRPLYVRWDAANKAFVLGAEWIEGRGIVPAPADRHVLRRGFRKLLGRAPDYPQPQPPEIDALLGVMRQVEDLLLACGLVGSGWQVCPGALVSTANLLKTADGYAVIDLESGIPAMLVPRYVLQAADLGAFPLFDDVDEPLLRGWVAENRDELANRLGPDEFSRFLRDVNALIKHTIRWKEAEPALGRNRGNIFRPAFWSAHKRRCLERWKNLNVVDEQTLGRIESGSPPLTAAVYALGLVPGRAGRFLQRMLAHRQHRATVVRFLRDREFRNEQLAAYRGRVANRLRAAGRIPEALHLETRPWMFAAHRILESIAPRALHRWISDPDCRKVLRQRAFLLLVSDRFQGAYGRYLIRQTINAWQRSGRLTAEQAAALHAQTSSAEFQEYACGFGIHLGLKLLSPAIFSLKIGGVAAFLKTGDPVFLLPIMFMPALRTAVTLWRMFRPNRSRNAEHGEALIVGALPLVGWLAYPVQMYSTHPELSIFLIREAASRAGRWLPIYGGRDSRTEIAAIRLMDPVIETIDIGVRWLTSLRSAVWRRTDAPAVPATPRAERWAPLVDLHLALLEQAEGEATARRLPLEPASPLPPQPLKHAA